MKRIAFLLGGFQNNGGIGRVTSILANRLQLLEKYEIHTISYVHDERDFLYHIDSSVKQFALFTTSLSMTKAIFVKNAIGKLRKYLRKNDIDLVIACGALYYPLAIMATIGIHCKCYCWEHINPATNTDYKFQHECRRMAIRFSDKIIVLTKSAEKYYLEKLHCSSEKLIQIYNPSICPLSGVSYDSQSKRIIVVGRLCKQKNYGCVLDLAALLKEDYPEWQWDIYGEGDLREDIGNNIIRKGLQNHVHMMGQVADLYERYPYYSFMVMTSLYEGFPMALLEGMSVGLPLVSFDIETGPNEIIEDGVNGYLISPFDIEKMYNKIVFLINNEIERRKFSDNSRLLSRRFDLDTVIKQWEEII